MLQDFGNTGSTRVTQTLKQYTDRLWTTGHTYFGWSQQPYVPKDIAARAQICVFCMQIDLQHQVFECACCRTLAPLAAQAVLLLVVQA